MSESGNGARVASGARFAEAVYRLVRRIPRGRVTPYGQIAAILGRPRAARAVGTAMQHCPADIPWHRVVNAHGGISRRARVTSMVTQRIRLAHEGIVLRGGRVILRRYRWEPTRGALGGSRKETIS